MKRDALATFFHALIISSAFSKFSIAGDALASNQSLKDGKTLVSTSEIFQLGFFSPGSSKNRYLGIWYVKTPAIVVWVANRNNPIADSQGVLTISSNKSLVLLSSTQSIIWSSNTSNLAPETETGSLFVQLLDTGNLVLSGKNKTDSDSYSYLWQSFDSPTDTRLPGMKLGRNSNTGLDQHLTSWKSMDDPSPGEFTYEMENHGLPQMVVKKGSTKKYRTGPWNGVRFSGLPVLPIPGFPGFRLIIEFNENNWIDMYEPYDNNTVTTRVTLNQSGLLEICLLKEKSSTWETTYMVPNDECDNYGQCGPNGICRTNKIPKCECLKGFVPKSQNEWEMLDWANGCVRSVQLDCQKGEGFAKVAQVKLPDLLGFQLNASMSPNKCKLECLKNCSCVAYANSNISEGGSGCLMWFGDLLDTREFMQGDSEQHFWIRLPASVMESISYSNKKKKRLLKIILPPASLGLLTLGVICGCIIISIRRKGKGLKGKKDNVEVPLFGFETIAAATRHFSHENMIGEGGFGPVYKGKLSMEQDIAVKRMSKNSGQGLEEFKNEVASIAKLQHRNLVRLLGCCIQGEERMLIYEYMSNKSLDYFIYDQNRKALLAWQKRFDIVMGVARGLLYLHQDSRLRIIHRDLKASNVLLDSDLIPKISDFGLARIVEGEQISARTKRIIGTYGYMSPEYAIDGKFSAKSDVFSLGVLLLEIVSGKRNRGFRHPDHYHNLLGHAWLLWNTGKPLELMDACLKDSCVESQVQRCIQVGLLCVQNFPEDRPKMTFVVSVLGSEVATLPQPKQPGFFLERSSVDTASISANDDFFTDDRATITILEGR